MGELGMNAAIDSKIDVDNNAESKTQVTVPINEAGLKSKYGKIYEIVVTVDEDDEHEGRKLKFLFKSPSAVSFSRYIKTVNKNIVSASAAFLKDNIIAEQAANLEYECKEYPALALNISQKLLNVLGFNDSVNFRQL